jgi:hypothetical protein
MSFNNKRGVGIIVMILVTILVLLTQNSFVVYASSNDSNSTNITNFIESDLEIILPEIVYVNESFQILANYDYENGSIIGVNTCYYNNQEMGFNMSTGYYFYPELITSEIDHNVNINCYKSGYQNLLDTLTIDVQSNIVNDTNITIDNDHDNDGYNNDTDCDDNNNNVNPGMDEVYYNSIDDDCNSYTTDHITFNVTTSKSSYGLQEVVNIEIDAINTSDTYITINTPTNVSYVYIFSNGSYPVTQQFALTGLTGSYTVEAINYLGDYTNIKNLEFEVENSMNLEINVDKTIAYVNEEISFSAIVTGAIGQVDIVWNMDDSTEKFDLEFDHKYTTSGTKNIVIIANDEGGNQIIKTISVEIEPLYYFKIKVIDNETIDVIKDVTVELDNIDLYTNSSGKVEYNVTNKNYDLEIYKSGYEDINIDIDINGSTSLTFRLQKDYETLAPNVTLISPGNNSNSYNEFKFKFSDNTNATCTMYVSEDDNWWIDVNESNVKPNIEFSFRPNITYDKFKWRVHCVDDDDNVGISKQYFVNQTQTVLQTSVQEDDVIEQAEPDTTFNIVQEVYNIIPDFDRYSPDERVVVQILDLELLLKDARRRLDMANRDLFNINREQSTDEIIEKRDEIYARIDQIKDETPLTISVTDKGEFIKYLDEVEVEDTFNKYLDIKSLNLKSSDLKRLLNFNKELQRKVSISTVAYNVDIKYISSYNQSKNESQIQNQFNKFVSQNRIDIPVMSNQETAPVQTQSKPVVQSTQPIQPIQKPTNIVNTNQPQPNVVTNQPTTGQVIKPNMQPTQPVQKPTTVVNTNQPQPNVVTNQPIQKPVIKEEKKDEVYEQKMIDKQKEFEKNEAIKDPNEYFQKNPIIIEDIVKNRQKELQIEPLKKINFTGLEKYEQLDDMLKTGYQKAYERMQFLRKKGFDTNIVQFMIQRIPAKIKVYEASKEPKDEVVIKRYLNEAIEELNQTFNRL